MAAGGTSAAAVVRWALGVWVGDIPPYITFYPVAIAAAVIGGTAAGISATILSALTVDFFFIEPVGRLWPLTPAYATGMALFVGINIVLSVVGGRLRAAYRQLWLQAAALKSAANAMVITDRDGAIQWINPAFERLTGYSAAEAVGVNPRVLKSGKQDRAFFNQMWQVIQAGQVWQGELINKRKDGSLYHEEMTITPVKDAGGVITHFIAVKQDITERRQAGIQLARQAKLLDLAPVLARDLDDHIIFWSKGVERLYGWSKLEAIGRVSHELFQASLPLPVEQIKAMLLQDGSWEGELLHTRKDGQRVIVASLWVLQRDGAGQPSAILEVDNDITQLRRTEQSHAKLAAIVENSMDAIVSTTLEGVITSWNEAAERLLGYSPAQSIGQSIDLTIPLDRRKEEALFLERLRDGERVAQYETVRQARDGRRIEVLVTLSPVRDNGGRLVGASRIIHDITHRKRADEALHASQERLSLTTLAAKLGTWDWNIDSDELIWSPRCFELFGLAPDTPLSYSRFLEAVYAEDRARIDQAVRTALEQHQDYDVEMRTLWPDSSLHWVTLRGRASYDGSGRPTRLSGVALDITRRKEAEAGLRESEERMRLFLETTPASLAVFDREMRYLAVSHRWMRDYGLTGTIVGRSHYEVLPDLPESWKEAYRRALAGEVLQADEDRFDRADGTTQWVKWEVLPWHTAAGEIGGIMIATENITRRKMAEAALQRQNQRLQILYQSATDLLLSREPAAILRGLHRQIEQDFGTDVFMLYVAGSNGEPHPHMHLRASGGLSLQEEQRLRTLRFGRAVCVKGAEALQPLVATHLQTREGPNRRFVRKLGFQSYLYYPLVLRERLLGTLAFASRQREAYEAADLEFFQTIARTLAEALERKRLEEELQLHATRLGTLVEERTMKLRESVHELEGFSHSLIHDLRAPLRSMHSFGDLLEQEWGGSLPPEGRAYLRRITESSKRLDQLITDSLNYSKIAREALPIRPVNLARLLHGIIESYPSLQPPGADIAVEFRDLVVMGNESALTQCFSNLLGNAVKFVAPETRPRVRIWVETGHAGAWKRGASEPGPASGATFRSPQATHVRIWVKDNGIGIPKDLQEKIFGLFQRLHRPQDYPGNGIGLAIARKAVQRMGGRIGLESEPGTGSRFWVELESGR